MTVITISRPWWHMPITPTLGRGRLDGYFQTKVDCIRPCLKTQSGAKQNKSHAKIKRTYKTIHIKSNNMQSMLDTSTESFPNVVIFACDSH